jgi:hypothetical protein
MDTKKITGGNKDLRYVRSIGSGGGGAVYAVRISQTQFANA